MHTHKTLHKLLHAAPENVQITSQLFPKQSQQKVQIWTRQSPKLWNINSKQTKMHPPNAEHI